ncbi:MAG: hypothetical protein DMD67_00590 [Gemmatimonadetes bacterium]|nr:MAG: hypothetical protein DMD67_00590 [Gemmatimonadota bacterium]
MDRSQLLKRLDKAWEAFRESYAGLSNAELEEEALTHLPLIVAGGRPPRYSVTYGGIDAFNAKRTEERKDLLLVEVLRRQEDVHRRLIALIESAPDDQVNGETRFRRRLRLDTYGHYPKHERAIRKWREQHAQM